MELPEFMVRVKLPDPNGYANCPSGDTDYDMDYNKAIKKATPEGFKVIEERPEISRPRDSSGYTYMRLKCVNENVLIMRLQNELLRLNNKLVRMKAIFKEDD